MAKTSYTPLKITFAVPKSIIAEINKIDESIGSNLKAYASLNKQIDKSKKQISGTWFDWLKKKRQKNLDKMCKKKEALVSTIKAKSVAQIETMEFLNKRYPGIQNLPNLIGYYRKQLLQIGIEVPSYNKDTLPLSEDVNQIANEAYITLQDSIARLNIIKEQVSALTEFREMVKETTDWIKVSIFQIDADIKYIDDYIKINGKHLNPTDIKNYTSKKSEYGNVKIRFKSEKGTAKYGQYYESIQQAKKAIIQAGGSEGKPLKGQETKLGDLGNLMKACESGSATESQIINLANNFKLSCQKAKNIIDNMGIQEIKNLKINKTMCK